jgi:Arc/MetJ family transcription regulator
MRTNIVLDDDLVKEAFKYTNAKTKRELIAIALKEFVWNRHRLNLFDLEGKIEFAEGYDYKSMREKK